MNQREQYSDTRGRLASRFPSRCTRIRSAISAIIVWPLLVGLMLWCAAALWFDGPRPDWLAGSLAGVFAAGCGILLIFHRPLWRAKLIVAVGVLLIIVWWLAIPPRNTANWSPDVAQLPRATFRGDAVTIQNVRNFDYRSETDFTERWETRTYDLSKVRGVDLFLSFWGPTLIAHTIMSWDFAEGPPLAISIETRKERGEEYSAVRGFFRQYEVYYVVADERDLVRLRTNYRGETTYLYRLRGTPAQAQALLREYLAEVNRLAEQPRWYNALTHNCTTTIRQHVKAMGAGRAWDWRVLANGRLDELGYERGQINTSLPFAEMKARSNITDKAKAADQAADFSRRIRDGLPDRPAAMDAAHISEVLEWEPRSGDSRFCSA